MKRVVNLVGLALTLAGVALLAYVGWQWKVQRDQHQAYAAPVSWSPTEREQGRAIASRLAGIADRLARTSSKTPPGSEIATRIVIPRISLNAPVVETAPVDGVWEVADWAVGHLSTTPNPGGVGNNALSAHDDIKGEVFKRLGELRPGDKVYMRTKHFVYLYIVTSEQAVDPSDVAVLGPTTQPTITMISCTPYWIDTQRLVIQGLLKSRTAA